MIDSLSERPISLSAAAKVPPRRPSGKRLSTKTLYRWTDTGCKGVVLESVQVGGTRCTSREALSRFFERLTAARIGAPPAMRTAAQRERAIADAEAELKRAGI